MQHVANLIDALDAPSALADQRGIIICHNPAFAAHCLRGDTNMTGLPLSDVWDPCDKGTVTDFVNRVADAQGIIAPLVGTSLIATAVQIGSAPAIFCQGTLPHFQDPLLRFFLEHVDQGFWDYDTRTRRFVVSDAWRDMQGFDADTDLNDPERDWRDDIHPDDHSSVGALLDGQINQPFSIQYRRRHLKTGKWIWLLCYAKVIATDAAGQPLRIVGTDTDITEIKKDETKLAQLNNKIQLAVDVSGIGIFEFDVDTLQVFWDDRLLSMYGLPPGENTRSADSFERFLHPGDKEEMVAYLADCDAARSEINRDFRIVRPDGKVRHIRTMARYVDLSDNETKLIGVNIDVTDDVMRAKELERVRKQLEYDSRHDALTGLANRRLMDETIAEIVKDQNGADMCVMHLDLDHFKTINDTRGHAAGDAVLVHVGHTLRRILDDASLICRFGGDEFAVLFAHAPAAKDVASLADRIIAAFKTPFIFEGHACPFGISIGSATGRDRETVFAHADIALYAAKNAGRSCYRAHSVRGDASYDGNMRRRQDLIDALAEGRIECWYQPQFDARTHALVGAEALARLRLPDGAVLAPDDFLPLAEQSGLLADIEELIFQRVLTDQTEWYSDDLEYPPIAVNLSQHRLLDQTLVSHVAACLAPHHAIALELLETAFLDDPQAPEHKTIEGLRALGLSIELDDFGSGHASIVAMVTTRPDRIKIDRLLTQNIATRPDHLATLQAVVAIARAQGVGVVLEGIETTRQLEVTMQIDCDVLQGYALAPPQTRETFASTLDHVPRKQSKGS